MGLLYMAINIPKALTITFFITLIYHLKFMAISALTHLGLFKPPPEDDFSRDNSTNYILILDGSSPSLLPIPVHVVTAAIKLRLPVFPFSDLDSDDNLCTVCLDCIDPTDEIRELFNCNHVFHRLCLDTWVDEGQVTCPLCRSMLLPPKNTPARRCGGAGDPVGMLTERNWGFVSEQQRHGLFKWILGR